MSTSSQLSFAGGEIAPALQGRVDVQKYATALKTARNGFIMKTGGFRSRPGTEFIGEVGKSSEVVRLIPFIFSDEQTYVVEIGLSKIRFYRNSAQVRLTAQNITAITNANPCVVTYSGSDTLANGDEVYISGITGAIGNYLNGRTFKVANVNTGANTFSLKYMDGSTDVNSTAFGSYTSGGTFEEVYEISSPYTTAAHLPNLKFAQSGDVITITHPSYNAKYLTRSGHTSWTLTDVVFEPDQVYPLSVDTDRTPAKPGFVVDYCVTAVSSDGEESLAIGYAENAGSAGSHGDGRSDTLPSGGSPTILTWAAAPGAVEYRIYRADLSGNPYYHLVTVDANTLTYTDDGTPPVTYTTRRPRFLSYLYYDTAGGADNKPACVTYFQQRQWFANFTNDTEMVLASHLGHYENFSDYSPNTDSDAVEFPLVGPKISTIRHLVTLDGVIALTASSEVLLLGDQGGAITPTTLKDNTQSYSGCAELRPLIADESLIFLQARQSIVQDMNFDLSKNKYSPNDLTVFSHHLFKNKTISDWDFQKNPHSIIWAARSDGALLSLTYNKAQNMLAWTRHDFDGTVENVCVVPEGTEDVVYLCIKRTINGSTKRYIERFSNRDFTDVLDFIGMDSTLSYDGRNTNASHTMTLSGGTDWLYTETLTLTSSTSYFISADVGNEIQLTGSDGTLIRFSITGYTGVTVVTGKAHKTVPAAMRNAAISDWTKAVDEITGLWHLEGKAVSIFADGFVVGSPNNSAYDTYTVTNGAVTLNRPYGVIHIGLSFLVDVETLNINTAQGETLEDKNKLTTSVTGRFEETRGVFAGAEPPSDDEDNPLENLFELKIRNEEGYDSPVDLLTGVDEIQIAGTWNDNGRVFIRQVDPLPMTLLSVHPAGFIPGGG